MKKMMMTMGKATEIARRIQMELEVVMRMIIITIIGMKCSIDLRRAILCGLRLLSCSVKRKSSKGYLKINRSCRIRRMSQIFMVALPMY